MPCWKIESDMKEMEEECRDSTTVHLYHKKEAKSRILADTKDRTGPLKTLDTCLHPSEPPGESTVWTSSVGRQTHKLSM